VRIVSERRLGEVLAALPGIPRVVASGIRMLRTLGFRI